MARDLYKDINWTATEIETLKGICNSSSTASEKLRLINSEIFAPHNIELHYYGKRIQTTLTKPIQYETTRLSNIKYENNQLIIVNSVVITEIKDITTGQFLTASGCELSFIKLNDANMNNVGFKINGENKKTIFTFNKRISYADEQVRMALSERDNAVYSLTIDDLYKINGKNLNKTGFLKYPIHEQTTKYEQTSPYVIYQDNANTNNLKFVGFPEYKINEGKTKENIILNGYCDVKISPRQVDQYNLPYTIAGHKNNKELNLINYCLPLFNNFDNPLYDNLQIKYENNILYLKTPWENGKYKIGKINFNPETEKLICYQLAPITTEPITADRTEDQYQIPWIKNIITNIECIDNKQTFKSFIAYHVSNSVFCLNENWNINCDFQYNTQQVFFRSLTPNNNYATLNNVSDSLLDSKEWHFLISYSDLTKTTTVDHTWSYDPNGTNNSLGYGLFKIDGQSYTSYDLNSKDKWDNLTQNGYVSTYQYGSSDFGYILRGYKASITFKIQNFPNFRGKYVSFSTDGIYDINNHTRTGGTEGNFTGTHWYGTNNDNKNYGVDKDNAIKYGFIESGTDFNGQSLLLKHNLLRVKNRGLIYRQGGNQPQVKNYNWTIQNGIPSRVVGFSRYADISIDKNSSLGLYALWLQTDDTTKQITWKEYSE